MVLVYLIGSLRNPRIPEVANVLRKAGLSVFDDWHAPGPETDAYWQQYEQLRGRAYVDALQGAHARDVFEFDKRWLEAADIAVLVAPAGKSAHIELGWMLGRGKRGYVLLDGEPERFDIMLNFADGVFYDIADLLAVLLDQGA